MAFVVQQLLTTFQRQLSHGNVLSENLEQDREHRFQAKVQVAKARANAKGFRKG